jgi:hypothetical protein
MLDFEHYDPRCHNSAFLYQKLCATTIYLQTTWNSPTTGSTIPLYAGSQPQSPSEEEARHYWIKHYSETHARRFSARLAVSFLSCVLLFAADNPEMQSLVGNLIETEWMPRPFFYYHAHDRLHSLQTLLHTDCTDWLALSRTMLLPLQGSQGIKDPSPPGKVSTVEFPFEFFRCYDQSTFHSKQPFVEFHDFFDHRWWPHRIHDSEQLLHGNFLELFSHELFDLFDVSFVHHVALFMWFAVPHDWTLERYSFFLFQRVVVNPRSMLQRWCLFAGSSFWKLEECAPYFAMDLSRMQTMLDLYFSLQHPAVGVERQQEGWKQCLRGMKDRFARQEDYARDLRLATMIRLSQRKRMWPDDEKIICPNWLLIQEADRVIRSHPHYQSSSAWIASLFSFAVNSNDLLLFHQLLPLFQLHSSWWLQHAQGSMTGFLFLTVSNARSFWDEWITDMYTSLLLVKEVSWVVHNQWDAFCNLSQNLIRPLTLLQGKNGMSSKLLDGIQVVRQLNGNKPFTWVDIVDFAESVIRPAVTTFHVQQCCVLFYLLANEHCLELSWKEIPSLIEMIWLQKKNLLDVYSIDPLFMVYGFIIQHVMIYSKNDLAKYHVYDWFQHRVAEDEEVASWMETKWLSAQFSYCSKRKAARFAEGTKL